MRATRHPDLAVAGIWAAATLLVLSITDSSWLRAAISAPLLFFLPGHVFVRAIGLRAGSAAEHVVYAIGASIAICVAGGLALDWAGLLTPWGWAGWLAATTGAAALLVARGPAMPAFAWFGARLPGLPRWQLAVLVISTFIVCGAYAMAVRDEAGQKQFRFTEFWLQYGASAAPGMLLVGIDSAEARPQRFDVEVALDGHTIALWRSVTLDPGNLWTRVLPVPPGAGRPRKSEARLYRADDNAIYRKVSALIPADRN